MISITTPDTSVKNERNISRRAFILGAIGTGLTFIAGCDADRAGYNEAVQRQVAQTSRENGPTTAEKATASVKATQDTETQFRAKYANYLDTAIVVGMKGAKKLSGEYIVSGEHISFQANEIDVDTRYSQNVYMLKDPMVIQGKDGHTYFVASSDSSIDFGLPGDQMANSGINFPVIVTARVVMDSNTGKYVNDNIITKAQNVSVVKIDATRNCVIVKTNPDAEAECVASIPQAYSGAIKIK
ncbi:MAG: hypothetical protein WCO33_03755 [bacterium]